MMTMMMMLPGRERKARGSNAPAGALNERAKIIDKVDNRVNIRYGYI